MAANSDTRVATQKATKTALALKANIASPTFTGTVTIPTGASITAPTGLVKGDVGLGNVDNTADASKAFAGSQITSGTVPIARIPTGTTSSTVPLGGVITGAGPTGDASHTLALTYNNAGQVTAVTNNAIAIAESQVTNLTTDLAAKQSTTLTSAHLLVGNGSNVATDTAITGDVTISNSGVTAIGSGKVTNAQLAGSIDLTAKVTGILPVANGGQGANTLAAHGVVVGNGSSAVNVTGAGTSNQVLASNGASADPTFKSITSNDASVAVTGLDLSVTGTPLLNVISRLYFK
jgi:hypothetical protein